MFSQQFSEQDDIDSFGTEDVDKTFMIYSKLHGINGICEEISFVCCWADKLKLLAWSVHEHGA
jgi:hypothetical protein